MKMEILLIQELLLVEDSLIPPSANKLRRMGSSSSLRVCSFRASYMCFSDGVPNTSSKVPVSHPVFRKYKGYAQPSTAGRMRELYPGFSFSKIAGSTPSTAWAATTPATLTDNSSERS